MSPVKGSKVFGILLATTLFWALFLTLQQANTGQATGKSAAKSASSATRKSESKSEGKKSPGWKIDYSSNFAGIVSTKFYEQALYMRLEKMGLIIITKGPTWNTLIYNESNKKYVEMTYEEWRQKFAGGIVKRRVGDMNDMKSEETGKKEKIEGVEAREVVLWRKNPKRGDAEEKASIMWVSNLLRSPPHFKQFLTKSLHIPENVQGTPLKISVSQKDRLVPSLEAYKISKVKLDADDFQPLPGYTKVRDFITLMLDDESGEGGLDGLSGVLGK